MSGKGQYQHYHETTRQIFIYCPYCGEIYDEEEKPIEMEDEVKCQFCDEWFSVKQEILYTTEKLDRNE